MNKRAHKEHRDFIQTVWDYYYKHGRDFLWRRTKNPYHILVSEFMLQQTQTSRVIKKFDEFLSTFKNVHALAHAPLGAVLRLWQGLGYNRRAKYIHLCAKQILAEHNGEFPKNVTALRTLPGIGPYTASAVAVFSYNIPEIMIETNIRTVFLHHFFSHETAVHDKSIMPLIKQTLDNENPRDWYYALMDYGVYLKRMHKNINIKSSQYKKQSKFHGSDRQVRGAIIRIISKNPKVLMHDLYAAIDRDKEKIDTIVSTLKKEGLLKLKGEQITL